MNGTTEFCTLITLENSIRNPNLLKLTVWWLDVDTQKFSTKNFLHQELSSFQCDSYTVNSSQLQMITFDWSSGTFDDAPLSMTLEIFSGLELNNN